MKYIIGVDIGTTGTKALLFRETGELIKTAYRGYEIISEKPGYAEQNPSDWYYAAAAAVKQCAELLEESETVTALSISAQAGRPWRSMRQGFRFAGQSAGWTEEQEKRRRSFAGERRNIIIIKIRGGG